MWMSACRKGDDEEAATSRGTFRGGELLEPIPSSRGDEWRDEWRDEGRESGSIGGECCGVLCGTSGGVLCAIAVTTSRLGELTSDGLGGVTAGGMAEPPAMPRVAPKLPAAPRVSHRAVPGTTNPEAAERKEAEPSIDGVMSLAEPTTNGVSWNRGGSCEGAPV